MPAPVIAEQRPVIFCPECGQKNEAAADYCGSCGTKITTEQSSGQVTSTSPKQNLVASASFASISQALKRFPKKFLKIAVVGVAAIAVIVLFFAIGNSVTDPAGVAKGYFKAVSSGDFDKAFEYLALESTDFVNKDSFKKYMEEQGGKIENLINYTVAEKGTKDAMSKEEQDFLSQWEKLYGKVDNTDEDSNDLIKTYVVRYTVKGSTSEKTQNITLLKSNKKKLLFF